MVDWHRGLIATGAVQLCVPVPRGEIDREHSKYSSWDKCKSDLKLCNIISSSFLFLSLPTVEGNFEYIQVHIHILIRVLDGNFRKCAVCPPKEKTQRSQTRHVFIEGKCNARGQLALNNFVDSGHSTLSHLSLSPVAGILRL